MTSQLIFCNKNCAKKLNILADEFVITKKKGAKKCFIIMNFQDVKDMFLKCIF